MTQKLQYYQDVVDRLLAADRERDKAFEEYANMYHGDWALPADIANNRGFIGWRFGWLGRSRRLRLNLR